MKKQYILEIKWTISKAKDSEGFNICTLIDHMRRKYSTCGGGYDMIGTVLGNWLWDIYKDKLKTLTPWQWAHQNPSDANRGLIKHDEDNWYVEGGCGLDAMIKLAENIGLEVIKVCKIRTGHISGFIVRGIE